MKISDRGLSYSINRASKEQLYIPVDPVHTYQAKAWIDMLGFRVFKVFGSAVILLLTVRIETPLSLAALSVVVIGICVVWALAVAGIRQRYTGLVPARVETAAAGVA